MPLAMALLIVFVLNPLVSLLRRWHFPHPLAVTLIVTLAFSLLGGLLLILGQQFNNLAVEIPRYEDNIRAKIHDLRGAFSNDGFDRIKESFQQLKGEFSPAAENTNNTPSVASAPPPSNAPATAATAPPTAPPAESDGGLPGTFEVLTMMLGPVSSIIATGGLVIVLVVFILLRRDDQRNRLILLGGLKQSETTNCVLSEVSQRISRYLLTYTLLNSIYGLAVAIGLWLIGLPFALLWGGFAAVMRFIPYVGPWLGALIPITLSLAVFPGWLHPLLIAVFYAGIELTTNMVLEPIFYGRSAGVSEVGLIIALAFWTWVWGPMGLLLGTPLTVCLVVLAKHLPGMELFHLLIGDGPVEEKGLLYYDRLCAGKGRKAQAMFRDHLKQSHWQKAFDDLLLPALVFLQHDRLSGKLSEDSANYVLAAIRKSAHAGRHQKSLPRQKSNARQVREFHRVIAIPCGDVPDELAFQLLSRMLHETDVELEILPPSSSSKEIAAAALKAKPDAIILGALPPGAQTRIDEVRTALEQARYRGPLINVTWGLSPQMERHLGSALGADYVGNSFDQTCTEILEQLQSRDGRDGESAETSAHNCRAAA